MWNLKKNLFVSFISALLLNACSTPSDIAVEYVEVNGKKIPKIWVEKIQNETEIKFTDWFEDIRLIPLESTENSLIRYTMRTYVGEDYIIVSTVSNGVLMFNAKGKFMRAVAPHGGGPGEVTDANRNIFVDEKNNKLYITDSQLHRDKLLCVDIISGEIDYIPYMNTGGEYSIRDIIVLQDSLMYCTTMAVKGRKSSNPVFCQTTSGKLLWELQKTHPLGLTNAGINLIDGKIYFNYIFAGDTIYQLLDQDLIPVAMVSTDKSRSYLEKEVGSMSVGMSPITDNWFKGSFSYVEDLVIDERSGRVRETMSDRQSFVFNTESGRAELIGQIHNDYFGFDEKFYLQFHYNGKGVVTYQALDLLEMADSVVNLPDISKELKSRLENILQTVDENDNPYLLVGRLKSSL